MSEIELDDSGGQSAGSGSVDAWLTLQDDHRIILYALVSLALVLGGHRTWREYHRYRENAARRAKIRRLLESSRKDKEKERERKLGSTAEAVENPPLAVAGAKSNTHDEHFATETTPDSLHATPHAGSSKSLSSSTSTQDLKARSENATGAKRPRDRRKRGRDVYKEVLKQERKKSVSSTSPSPSSSLPSSPLHPNSTHSQASENHSFLQVQQTSGSDADASRSRSRSRSSSRGRSNSYSRMRSDSPSRSRSCLREQFGEVEEAEEEGMSEITPKADAEARAMFTESTFNFDLPPPETARATRDADGQSDHSFQSASVPESLSSYELEASSSHQDYSFSNSTSIPSVQNGNVHIDESSVSTSAGRQEPSSNINGVAATTNMTMIRRKSNNNNIKSRTPTPPLTHSGPSSNSSTSSTASESVPVSGSTSTSVSVSGFESTLIGGNGATSGSPVLRSFNLDFDLELHLDPRTDETGRNVISISHPIPSVPSEKGQPLWLDSGSGEESRSRGSSHLRSTHYNGGDSRKNEDGVNDVDDVATNSRREHAPKTPSSSSFSSIAVSDTSASASITSTSASVMSSSSAWAETRERAPNTSIGGSTAQPSGSRSYDRRRVSKGNTRGKSKSPPPPRFRSLSRPSGGSGSASGSGSGSVSRSRGSPYHSNSLPLPLPLPLPMTSLSAGVSPSSTPPPYTPGLGHQSHTLRDGLGLGYGYRAASESAVRRRAEVERSEQRREVERYKSDIESLRVRWSEDVERGRRREAELQAQLQLVTSQMHALSLTVSQMQMHPHPYLAAHPHTPHTLNSSPANHQQRSQQQQQSDQQATYPMYSYAGPGSPPIPVPYLPLGVTQAQAAAAMYPYNSSPNLNLNPYAYPLMSPLPHMIPRSAPGSRSGSVNGISRRASGSKSESGSRSGGRNGSGNASPAGEHEHECDCSFTPGVGCDPASAAFAPMFGFGFGFGVGENAERGPDDNENDNDEERDGDREDGENNAAVDEGVGAGVSEELVEAILKRPNSINIGVGGRSSIGGRSPSAPISRRTWSGSTRSASANGIPNVIANGNGKTNGVGGSVRGVEGRATSEGFTFASLSELGNPQPHRRWDQDKDQGQGRDRGQDDGTRSKNERNRDWLVFDTNATPNPNPNTDSIRKEEAGVEVEIPLVASPEMEEAHVCSLVLDPECGQGQDEELSARVSQDELVRSNSESAVVDVDAEVKNLERDSDEDGGDDQPS
ncbi:hypothetical protein ACEPAI_8769 [Sanghuangporus weigelae]